MIIRQTTTIIFEYPQDYLQEQEWCKTKDDRWVHKGTDTLGAVYENQISYSIGVSADRKTESSSEKPNNCEYCIWSVCNYNKAFKDEPQGIVLPRKGCHRPIELPCHSEQGDGYCANCIYWHEDFEGVAYGKPQTERCSE